MKKPKLLVIAMFFMVLFTSHFCFALTVCLYARSTNDPASGHAFINVQDKGRTVESYGLWPNDKLTSAFPNPIAINRTGDFPMAVLRKMNVIIPAKMEKMLEGKVCADLAVSREVLREKALSYTTKEEYGPYRSLQNNCTHFAVRMFNFATDSEFPVVVTPKKVNAIIRNL